MNIMDFFWGMIFELMGWMGSFLFWGIYISCSFTIGVLVLKRNATKTYNELIDNKTFEEPFDAGVAIFLNLVFWPFAIAWEFFSAFCIGLVYILSILGKCFLFCLRKIIKSTGSLQLPKIKITMGDD